LIVADLALLACLELLPGLLLHHRRICIQVLALEPDLFELLGKACLLFTLLFFLLFNFAVNFKQSLFLGCLGLSRQ